MENIELVRALTERAKSPMPHQVLVSILKDYLRPNDKINELVQDGFLSTVKKGLYIAGPKLNAGRPEPCTLANVIYGPSYVSLETALSFHGMIPEKVFETTSMTTKAARRFETSEGDIYSYTKLPLPYYAYGIEQIRFSNTQTALMASREKSICDKIVTAPGTLRSVPQARAFLIENLRVDPAALRDLRRDIITTWIADSPKRTSLQIFLKTLHKL